MPADALDYITIKGFKSIVSVEKLELRPINVLIGANGSGKSNFIGAFAFLREIREGRLGEYVKVAGGAERVPSFKVDIVNHLKEDPGCFATTMIDYYGMPLTWPGRTQATRMTTVNEKAQSVEDAISNDVAQEMGDGFYASRFAPFFVMHEFKGLLFSDCAAFNSSIERPDLRGDFQRIRDGFSSPEEINDSKETAPSKRIETLIPKYEKPFLGVLAALAALIR